MIDVIVTTAGLSAATIGAYEAFAAGVREAAGEAVSALAKRALKVTPTTSGAMNTAQ
jgi:hypothetical protein